MSFDYPLVVCLAARNEAACFPGLIASLKSSSIWSKTAERYLFVALNGCTDESAEVLNFLQDSEFHLRIIESKVADKNAALNQLLAESHGLAPFIAFMDAEVLPGPSSIERLFTNLQSSQEVDLITARPVQTLYRLKNASWYQRCRYLYSERPWLLQGSGELSCPRANLYALRSTLAEEFRFPEHSGIMDDYFFSKMLGKRVQVDPTARVYVTPPTYSDHVRQRTRQRWGLLEFQRRYPRQQDGRSVKRIRFPSFSGIEELLFFVSVQVEERWSRYRAATAPTRVEWKRISSARPVLESAPPVSLRVRMLQPLQRLVVASSHTPRIRSLQVWLYQKVSMLWANALRRLPGVEACLVAGSASQERLSPGLSDIDGTVVLEDLPTERELKVVEKVVERQTKLRRVFPILQEPVTFRKREMMLARRCGEPWLTDRSYQVLSGPEPDWLGLNPHNRDAHLALFLRRFLRFYTRQAIMGTRVGLKKYIRLHPVGLASMNRLVRWSQENPLSEQLGSITLASEMQNPKGTDMEVLFSYFKELSSRQFFWEGPEIGPLLASHAYKVLQQVAGTYQSVSENKTPLPLDTVEESPAARYCKQLLRPLTSALEKEPSLRRFRLVLSSAGAHAWQFRCYLVSRENLEREEVEEAYRGLARLWDQHKLHFETSLFGVFPNPCLLPKEGLNLLHLSFQGSFEPAYLGSLEPILDLRPTVENLNKTVYRDITERAYLILRRLDLSSAPVRTSRRFLDTFFGLVPAVCLWLQEGRLELGPGKAASAYQGVFQDRYSEFLSCLSEEQLWFPPAVPDPSVLNRLQKEYYGVLRDRLDEITEGLKS